MTLEAIGVYALVIAMLAIPIGLTMLVDRKPQLLSPKRKLGVSLVLIVVGFAIPMFIPQVLTVLSPVPPPVVELLYPVFAVPQGFVGAAIASLLILKPTLRAGHTANFLWWSSTLLGSICTTTVVLATGVFFAGW